VDALLAELRSASNSLRQVAAEALGHIGDSRAVEALLGKLQNEGEFEGCAVRWYRRWESSAMCGQ
jgi:HEAT repeat protein